MSNAYQHTDSDMTVEDYLRGCVGFDITDEAIATILVDRGIPSGTYVVELDKRLKDLCKADLYMWCASTPSVKGSVEDANGVWKHKEGGTESSAFDKRNLRIMANDIYKRYGENTVKSTIKLNARGIRIWQK